MGNEDKKITFYYKYVARMGDAVCYDIGINGGVRIITDEHRTPEF